jgi:hypothetical protein
MAGRTMPAAQRAALSASMKAAWAARKAEAAAAQAAGGSTPAKAATTNPLALSSLNAVPSYIPLQERAAAAAAAALAGPFDPASAPEPEAEAAAAESVEAAVAELSTLRRAVGAWVAAFTRERGRPPTREDARAAAPETYAAFTRWLALRDYVRSAGT